tara:strand:- start:544 stop:1953 length:1410 start_codon:yes stop_codon:yes gene_type:complete
MCGIICIFNYKSNNLISTDIQNGLKNLQHRGQDSYGYFLSNIKTSKLIRECGLIKFHELTENYNIAIGHTRYATSYHSKNQNINNFIQPLKGNNSKLGDFYLVHNGNINNIKLLVNLFELNDKNLDELNDSQILVKIIESYCGSNFNFILKKMINSINGIFNLIIYQVKGNNIYILKDKFGNRPLCIGMNNYGYCIASESVGLGNYEYLREVNNGELLELNNNGLKKIYQKKNYSSICLFEYIYLQNKNSTVSSKHLQIEYEDNFCSVEDIRMKFGEILAKKEINHLNHNLNELIVIGAPNTGIPIGKSFAKVLSIPYHQFLIKNKNANRSFILKDDKSRVLEISKKFSVDLSVNIKDKIIFFVDDSLVRGNTINNIINILKSYNPKEVHIRIASPEVRFPCYNGIDIPTKTELIMNHYSTSELSKKLEINSIIFLSESDMINVLNKKVNLEEKDICMSCFNGKYLDLF